MQSSQRLPSRYEVRPYERALQKDFVIYVIDFDGANENKDNIGIYLLDCGFWQGSRQSTMPPILLNNAICLVPLHRLELVFVQFRIGVLLT